MKLHMELPKFTQHAGNSGCTGFGWRIIESRMVMVVLVMVMVVQMLIEVN